MSTLKIIATSLLAYLLISGTSQASTCQSHSSNSRVALIELYTSEGCSSCPPADRWLSGLVPNVVAAEEVVPLAFHVDYWDRLGWRDRFADASYTVRQNAYAKVSGSTFVFTPQVIMAGRNDNAWLNKNSVQNEISKAHNLAPDAIFELRQQSITAGKLEFEVQVQLQQGLSFGDVRVYAALFQNGLVSEVARGENKGRQLHHDYVVRNLLTSNAPDSAGSVVFKNQFTLPDDADAGVMGIAVFAQDVKTGVVLQAMSAPVCVTGK
jgi:hypothetical protein